MHGALLLLLLYFSFWILSIGAVWITVKQEITFKAGDHVTFLCLSNTTVESGEWRKSGMKQDECLLTWRGKHMLECNQHPSLRGRVVRSDLTTDRSASIVLKTTNASDAGTYECRGASTGSEPELICIVELKCEEPRSVKTWTTLHPKILQNPKGGGDNTGSDHVIPWSASDVFITAVLAVVTVAVPIVVFCCGRRSCSTQGKMLGSKNQATETLERKMFR